MKTRFGIWGIALLIGGAIAWGQSFTVPTGSGGSVDWSAITGIPAGFADGTDDGGGAGGPSTSNNIPTSAVTVFGSAPATNLLIDASSATVFRVVLTNNMGIVLTNGSDGQEISLELFQDSVGFRTVLFRDNSTGAVTNQVGFGTDLPLPVITTTNGLKMDVFKLRYVRDFGHTNRWNLIGNVRGY